MGKKNWKKKTLNFAYVKFKFQFGINTCRPRLLSSGESLSYFLLFFFFLNEAPSLRIKKIISLVYGLRKHYFFDILFRQNGRGPYDSDFLGLGDGNFPFRAACTRPSVRSSFSIENTVIRLLGHLACFHLNANKYYSRTCATS